MLITPYLWMSLFYRTTRQEISRNHHLLLPYWRMENSLIDTRVQEETPTSQRFLHAWHRWWKKANGTVRKRQNLLLYWQIRLLQRKIAASIKFFYWILFEPGFCHFIEASNHISLNNRVVGAIDSNIIARNHLQVQHKVPIISDTIDNFLLKWKPLKDLLVDGY